MIYFIGEAKPILFEPPLKFSGGLAKLRLTWSMYHGDGIPMKGISAWITLCVENLSIRADLSYRRPREWSQGTISVQRYGLTSLVNCNYNDSWLALLFPFCVFCNIDNQRYWEDSGYLNVPLEIKWKGCIPNVCIATSEELFCPFVEPLNRPRHPTAPRSYCPSSRNIHGWIRHPCWIPAVTPAPCHPASRSPGLHQPSARWHWRWTPDGWTSICVIWANVRWLVSLAGESMRNLH